MRYTSTRDDSISCTFEEALTSGYAPDGGLFVPERLPSITAATLQQWSTLTYPELTFEVLRLFVAEQEVDDEALRQVCTKAFAGFDDSAHAVPVKQVGSLYIAELWHGPTFCFKDLGMRSVVGLLALFSNRRQRPTTLLVSTTGDTGPAAVQAVCDSTNSNNNNYLSLLVHYPDDQISDFQRKQLTTAPSQQVRVAAFQGGGDDMDRPIKNILTDSSITQDGPLRTGVNSYNIGRPILQCVHYIWTYLRVVQALGIEPGDPSFQLDVVLPTGAMGNMAGGFMAKNMGLPLGRLCAGVNVNDISHRVVQTGAFYKSDGMKKTLSEAINVQLPYNFERLLYYLTDGNHELVQQWMAEVDAHSKLDLPTDWLQRLQDNFGSAVVTDEAMCATTRRVLDEYQYWVDPHTAVALAAAEQLGYHMKEEDKEESVSSSQQPPTKATAVLSTASPCKFEHAVTQAVGEEAWSRYVQTEFPTAAKDILTRPEVAPTIYKAEPGKTLEETQKVWEATARGIIAELERQAGSSSA